MINIEPFRHHNNHEDGARIIPTGSSESVLPPAALWVAQSYRLTPVRGPRGGCAQHQCFTRGVLSTQVRRGLDGSTRGVLQTRGPPVFHHGCSVLLQSTVLH